MEKLMGCTISEVTLPDYSEIAKLAEGACPVNWALRCVKQAQLENCGMSVMCRDGVTQLALVITDIVSGKGKDDDLSLIKELCQIFSTTAGCEMASKVAKNVLYSMEHHADEWEQHCRRKRCAALVCADYYSIYIDPTTCIGCGTCLRLGPEGSIAGGEGMIHVVLDDGKIKTEEFVRACPSSAIKKAGAVKPNLPAAPIPVGSFEVEGARKRRRERG
ncbi:MAG: hypothetical protein FWC76_06215 [Defluviitaleaceae bacterium]|nr:hypothetical protein [Defluviitaleaceae bacterium]